MLPSPLYALVVDEELRPSNRGKDFWQVVLKTCNGTFKGMMWEAPANAATNPLYPHKGEFVKIENFIDQLEDKKSIVVKLPVDKIKKEDYLKEYDEIVNSGGSASAEEIQEALSVIFDKSLFDNAHVFNFIKNCFKKYGPAKLKTTPAAVGNHHAYSGGLVIHVAEVLQTCKSMYEVYNKKYNYISKDMLYCSAILHDIGKLETYSINEEGVAEVLYTESVLGHLYLGMNSVEKVYAEMSAEEQEQIGGRVFLNEVLHCIATHHGRTEYGNIREIQSIEAQILSSADLVSSRFGMLDKTIKELPKGITSKHGDRIKLHSDTIFFNSTAIEKCRNK